MKKAAICILIPYYGKWPSYFKLFVESCRPNPIVDVYLISDLKVNFELPTNVKLINVPLADFITRLNQVAGTKRTDIHPTKLSDIKPAYGLMFNELTEGYEFWGYGDIDMVYGDLSRYLKPDVIASKDLLTFREEWIHGPLTILRNNEQTKNLFRLSTDHIKVFSSERNFCFDECGRKHGILRTGTDPLDVKVPHAEHDVHCMTQVVRAEELAGRLKVYRRYYAKESLPFDEIIWWEDGKIKGAGFAEYIFYHFVWDKKQKEFVFPNWDKIPSRYFITTTGFYKPGNRFWRLTHFKRKISAVFQNLFARASLSIRYRLKLS
jgi:hypothetical protein